MATERQLQLDQAFRRALKELGAGASSEFLIAAALERTQADPRDIIEAVEAVNCPDERTGDVVDGVASPALAPGRSVTAIWGNLPQDVQRAWFEHAVSAQDDTTRERLAVFLHAIKRLTQRIGRAHGWRGRWRWRRG
jgi:hypothetical protein